MNREQRRKLGFRGMTAEEIIDVLEANGGILWEPETSGGSRRGWAICPCCGKRELEVIDLRPTEVER